ncbi:NmrA family NAD(P)-binding protein [Halocalculus aciditolerans]|uniref:NmrA-like domain-containing protein n=1 Tax=Halocalculus aciditolerans TaxID=1383812 RepID=A0A830FAN2_9EURY|nr:NmrA family NAD(P)-binding protein [Halocalculus aciditolerans]GGL55650.1 hypothetical protein GCM10009039_12300 [Halocalculus aciditolerans]
MRVLLVGGVRPAGIAAAHGLADAGHAVTALARDHDSPPARRLAEAASLVQGRADQHDHVTHAAADADAVLAFTEGGGSDELRQGDCLATALDAADLDLAVYVSVGNADSRPGVPRVDAKADIEERLAGDATAAGRTDGIDAPVLVLRRHLPLSLLRESLVDGTFRPPLEPGVSATLTVDRDLGRFAAHALAEPERFAGETVELANARETVPDLAGILEGVYGEPIDYEYAGPRAASPAESAFFRWVNEGGLAAGVDPDALEKWGFAPTPLAEAVRDA